MWFEDAEHTCYADATNGADKLKRHCFREFAPRSRASYASAAEGSEVVRFVVASKGVVANQEGMRHAH